MPSCIFGRTAWVRINQQTFQAALYFIFGLSMALSMQFFLKNIQTEISGLRGGCIRYSHTVKIIFIFNSNKSGVVA